MSFDETESSPVDNQKQKLLGEILVEAGLVSSYQVEIALKEQEEYDLKIGEILALRGWIAQETVDFFVKKWQSMLQSPQKKPLVYYFQTAALLTSEQIDTLTKIQKKSSRKIRFHRLAVQQGYIKQKTVDFFLAHLFNIYPSTAVTVSDPYDILRSNAKGQTNFSRTELSKASLIQVTLKGIKLDGSNLAEANLNGANLSYSSLIQVNLNGANLRKAILTQANLTRALLNQANLQAAHLEKANFQGAKLQDVDLTGAYLLEANFSAAYLKGAKLQADYPYKVYYDRHTIFDSDFDPKQAGWQMLSR